MAKQFTVAQVARLIANSEGWDKGAEERIHRQVKHWRSSGILESAVSPSDGRGTTLFDAAAVLRSRLYVALADVGLDVEEIRSAMGGIAPRASGVLSSRDASGNRISEPYWEDAESRHWHFDVVTSRVSPAASERYFCKITILRDVRGAKVVSGFIYSDHESRETEESEEVTRRFRDFQVLKVQATATIPLTEILAGVLEALRDA